MRILIAYYSRTGGTEKVAGVLKKELEARGHSVDMEKVEPVEEHSFWGWWNIRMIKGECDIQPPKIKDVSQYDTVCIGSPNWTRLSLPMARYLKEIEGLRDKNVGFFATTSLPSILEWYVFSAYLLDFTFSRIIEKKKSRIIDSILLSSVFKRWSVASDYGKRVIKKFCERIETPTYSFKDFALHKKTVEENRLIVMAGLLFNFFLLFFQIFSSALGKQIFSWDEIFIFLMIGLFIYFPIITIIEKKKALFLGKYIAIGSLIVFWTFIVLFLGPTLGRVIILGYVFCIMITSFFRDVKVVIFSGLFAILGYGYLFLNAPLRGVFAPSLDLTLFLLSIGIVGFVTHGTQKHFISLLEIQDEIEIARTALEIKVKVRTSELTELAQSLEKKVKERTEELQGKVVELERFNRLAIGRELKMIELKKEIEKLKGKQIENRK